LLAINNDIPGLGRPAGGPTCIPRRQDTSL
jgi:hypothetical protein